LALLAACGGKVIKSDGDPGTGSSGTTGGGGAITVAPDQPPIEVPPVVTTTTTGGGSVLTAQPCGTIVCGEGMFCCNPGCGICAPQGQGCPQIGCAIPIDASGAGGAAGGKPNPPDLSDFARFKSDFNFMLVDSWFITGCQTKAGHDCIESPTCPNQTALDFEDRGVSSTETFPLGGTIGQTYAMTFKFNGVTEGKFYQGGSWALPSYDVATPGGPEPMVDENGIANNTFYIGGTAVPSNYNSLRMRVLDPNRKEVGRYYMNAYAQNSGAESHRTFLISYMHTIDVPGRGFVEFHIGDSNCHTIDNCGPGNVSDTMCDAARNIPNEPNAVLPAMYNDSTSPIQPHLVPLAQLNPITGGKQPWHSQISHFWVTKVVLK
jgi:hypothetical protein